LGEHKGQAVSPLTSRSAGRPQKTQRHAPSEIRTAWPVLGISVSQNGAHDQQYGFPWIFSSAVSEQSVQLGLEGFEFMRPKKAARDHFSLRCAA
jgi:hypothetical protein